jgi:hypothetical protein
MQITSYRNNILHRVNLGWATHAGFICLVRDLAWVTFSYPL